jgi:hypothetical protein
MATTQTIGTTGRNFSTLQAWEDAVPATPTGGYIGECYNDSEFSARVLIDGHTTSAVNFIHLTAAAGQSFQDHASVRSNPLYYDQTKGVGVSAAPSTSEPIIDIEDDYVTVDRLQVKRTGAHYGNGSCIGLGGSVPNSRVKDCIAQKAFSGYAGGGILTGADGIFINCVAINQSGTDAGLMGLFLFDACNAINCTIVNAAASAGDGIGFSYWFGTLTNCCSFGWANAFSGSAAGGTVANCASDGTTPGTNALSTQTFANQFESVTVDFRLKSGASLIDAGNTDGTNAPNDISGTARGLTGDGDIGAWEFSSGGGGGFQAAWARGGNTVIVGI